MKTTQRVDINTATLLVEAYRSCIGITIVDPYIYVFYPNKIRIYEQYPSKSIPQLSEERLIPHRKIQLYAVNKQFIVMLFDDSKLEVRSRQHWEMVYYSLNLQMPTKKVYKLEIKGQKIIYMFSQSQKNKIGYGFISISKKMKQTVGQAQILYLTQFNGWYDPRIHLRKLGSIEYFYLGLDSQKNQIKFGMYYNPENGKSLKQYEFGTIQEHDQTNSIQTFSMFETQQHVNESQDPIQIIYLVKILTPVIKQQDNNKLIIKYKKFYEGSLQIESNGYKLKMDDTQTNRLQSYNKMMHTLQQIYLNTNCIKNQSTNTNSQNQRQSHQQYQQYHKQQIIDIELGDRQYYRTIINNQTGFYITTNFRIFKLSIANALQSNKYLVLQELYNLGSQFELLDIGPTNLYLLIEDMYIFNQFESQNKSYKQNSQPKFISTNFVSQQVQTDLFDNSHQKNQEKLGNIKQKYKKVQTNVETQTQIEHEDIKTINGDRNQIVGDKKKSQQEISVGGNLPICPQNHEDRLKKINNYLLEIQDKLNKQILAKVKQTLQRQQQKVKMDISKRIDELLGSAISSTIIPIIQANVRQIFQTKLQQVNVYVYTLTMQNLLQIKQEIQKDQVKQNMLRTQLISKQLHEVSQSKKAVAQMVQICKARQMQKIGFFEQVKKKITQIQSKVLLMEQKVKSLKQYEDTNQSKFLDEIQVIKIMLKNQDPQFQNKRKQSILSQQKRVGVNIDEEGDDEQSDEENEQKYSDQSSSEYQYSEQRVVAMRINQPPPVYHMQSQPQPNPYYSYPLFQQYPSYPPQIAPHMQPPPYLFYQNPPINQSNFYPTSPFLAPSIQNGNRNIIYPDVIRHFKVQGEPEEKRNMKQKKVKESKIKSKKHH